MIFKYKCPNCWRVEEYCEEKVMVICPACIVEMEEVEE